MGDLRTATHFATSHAVTQNRQIEKVCQRNDNSFWRKQTNLKTIFFLLKMRKNEQRLRVGHKERTVAICLSSGHASKVFVAT